MTNPSKRTFFVDSPQMFSHIESLLVKEEFSRVWRLRSERISWAMVELANYDGAWNWGHSKRYKIWTRSQKVRKIFSWNFKNKFSINRDGNSHLDSSKTRRKSIYNFFLRHQDAVDDHMTSPSVHKKVMKPTGEVKPSETIFSMKPGESPTSPPTKSKRATSFIKKKPRLERGLSDQSVLRLNRNVNLGKFKESLNFK